MDTEFNICSAQSGAQAPGDSERRENMQEVRCCLERLMVAERFLGEMHFQFKDVSTDSRVEVVQR